MSNHLQTIILQKKREVAKLYDFINHTRRDPIALKRTSIKSFKNALNKPSLSVIAEIKRKSPSKGHLASINDPTTLAQTYVLGGANALSVLTDKLFFGGTMDDLTQIALAFQKDPTPILRKDFIIDKIQIAEAVMAGSDAILCIVAILGEKTKTILEYAKSMNIEVVVEVHNKKEVDIALNSGAEIIGINNRDLFTFKVDIQRGFNLIESIPKHIVSIAESGILNPELAKDYYQAGFNAVLIGEALVTCLSPQDFIRECHHE